VNEGVAVWRKCYLALDEFCKLVVHRTMNAFSTKITLETAGALHGKKDAHNLTKPFHPSSSSSWSTPDRACLCLVVSFLYSYSTIH